MLGLEEIPELSPHYLNLGEYYFSYFTDSLTETPCYSSYCKYVTFLPKIKGKDNLITSGPIISED